MRSSRDVAFAVFWLLVAGCATAPRNPMLDDVLGSWRLADVDVPVGAKIPTVTFAADGRIHGNAGVNRYQATIDTVALAAGQWRPSPISATRMAGAQVAMQLESSFLAALGAATVVVLAEGRLRLEKDGAPLAVLEPLTLR